MSKRFKMACGQIDHWSDVWLQCLLLTLFLCRHVVLPDNNRNFHTSTLCLLENDQPLYTKVDGAVVTSENERDMKCVVTFHTDSVLQTFMLRFEHLALDCNDHLYIYDGAHPYGKYEKDLSCRSTRNDVRTIFTKTNHVTLKYITDSWSHAGNGFRFIITAVRKPGAGCKGFRCLNQLCISQNLTCDGVNHCGDNSDETSLTFCGGVGCKSFRCLNQLCISQNLTCDGVNHCGDNSDETSLALCGDGTATKQILGLNFGTFWPLVFGLFLICCVCVGVIICVCCKEAQQRQLAAEALLATPHSMVVGLSPYPAQSIFNNLHCQPEQKLPLHP